MCSFTLTGAPLQTVLEVFGEHFLEYCYNNGYDKMLQTLGKDFVTFMQNLDSLHALLSLTYQDFDAPSFRYIYVCLKCLVYFFFFFFLPPTPLFFQKEVKGKNKFDWLLR